MGTVLVVDGSDVCRAPIVRFTMLQALGDLRIESRGLSADAGATMCESAATRLGFTGPAIGFYGAHRATPLTTDDLEGADLVLTAERAQRSAVVRMLPGTQATVFTWKEALVLASVLVDRRRIGALTASTDPTGLARALHGARGTVPLIEPPVRTGAFHWRRGAEADPLTIDSGHEGRAEHRRVTQESVEVASALASRLGALIGQTLPEVAVESSTRRRQLRRTA